MVASKSATCNDRTLDYYVFTQQFRHNVIGCRTVCDSGFNPHSPARIYSDDRAVTAWVQQPAPVPSLPAVLPHGRVTKRSSEASLVHDGETLDEFGGMVLAAIGTELYELTAHQCMIWEQSRADGPTLIWRQLQDQATSNVSRGNPLGHGWSVVAR